MKFSCEKALLQSAVMTAGRVVASKSSILALEGVLVEAEKDGLRVSGYNLETGIVTNVEANVVKTGAIVLSARLFGEIIRKLPDDVVSVETEGNAVHITCGPTSFDILSSSAEEFPELPQVDAGSSLNITQGNLRSMISKVIFETCYLTDDEKVLACRLAKRAGFDFVKTSTGFGSGGATAEDVALMRKNVGKTMGVKAAGGIRTLADALKMIEAGANRLGCSAGVEIVDAL